ncbi:MULTISPECIES: TonB-dependent siderophore receptor [unclassified Methylophaga]|uniref:TonB-dependent siderophore receptor n=1 Tax=unclassified Methylophaga TaxID=2629249 RepID=UPI000C8C1F60|nr:MULTISPECIES: TonB-dependent siderophore receptor [unclassified Methylophaga]MBN45575.1 TonB-dependent siderophore receptor [Methylophaga sp.]
MKFDTRRAITFSIASLCCGMAIADTEQQSQVEEQKQETSDNVSLDSLHVYGEPEETKSATKLDLTVFETPQIVSVISNDQIQDFALRDVNTLLRYAPGVTVEQVETGRTYYTARGFDIVNFQYDGLGVPFSFGLTQGHDDTAMYEKVEVIKGASGLITGLANPSATINFVRKRPTDEFHASAKTSYGSWNTRRIDVDLSGPINERVRGRLVVAKEKGDSYLDRYTTDRDVFYGIVSADLTDTTELTLAHSVNDTYSKGNSSGALPLFYSDGTLTSYDVSTNTAPDWAYQDVKQTRSFAELDHELSENWSVKAIYTQNKQEKQWDSFYLSGSPDAFTEEGLTAHASHYDAQDKEKIFDLYLSGQFELAGREHELVVGINKADIKLTGRSIYSSEWNYAPVGSNWAAGYTPRPAFDVYDADTQSTNIDQDQDSAYFSTRLSATDRLSFLLGARTVKIEQDGYSYGAPQKVSDSETVPYAGVTYEVIDGTMLYGSYSEVFKAQTWVGADLSPLGSVKGESREIGIKQEFNDGRAVLTLARFESRQENFGEWIDRDAASGLNIYRGVEMESKGYEIELSGEVVDRLNLSMGYTHLDIEDENGDKTRTFIPTNQFKVAASYHVPQVVGLNVGGGVRWQNEIYVGDVEVQGSYALVDMFAQYQLNQNVTLAMNLYNVGNEKYFESPQWGQANYGATRSAIGSVTWTY